MALHRLIVRVPGCALLVLLMFMAASVVHAVPSVFVQQANTTPPWNSTANWSNLATDPNTYTGTEAPPTTGGGTVPNAQGAVAWLQQRVTTSGTMGANTTYAIGLGSGTIKVGELTVWNTNNEYNTVVQSGTLDFDNGASEAVFNEKLGTGSGTTSRTRLSATVKLSSNLRVNQEHNLGRNTATGITQIVDGAADKTLTKDGKGSLTFEYGANSEAFFGQLVVEEGLVRLINGTNFTNSTFRKSKGITVLDGAQLQFGNGVNFVTLGTTATNPAITAADGKAELVLNGIGDTSNPSAPLPEGALRFDQTTGTNVTCTFDSPVRLQTTSRIYVAASDITGILSQEVRGDGSAGLNKGGAGLLKLTTASANGNTYAGATNISAGSLAVNNTVSTVSGVGSGNVNVIGAGSVLGGTGYIGTTGDASNVSVNTGGALQPGDLTATTSAPFLATSVGTLTIHGDLTFVDAASSLNIDINHSAADQVIDFGNIALGGAGLNFTIGTPALDGTESFTLIDNQGSNPISGEFGAINGVAGTYSEGSTVTLGSVSFKLTYAGGSGNNDLMLLPLAVAGDFNGDTKINAADYVSWRKNDGTDSGYAAFRENFQPSPVAGSSLSAASVPEPATIALVALIAPFFAPLVARRKPGRTQT